MKKTFTTLLSLFAGLFAWGQTNVVIYQESFETDGNGSRYFANMDSSSTTQYYRRYCVTTPPGFGSSPAWTGTGKVGNCYCAVENPASITIPSVQRRYFRTSNVLVSTYTNLRIQIRLADGRANHLANPNQWESNDSVSVYYMKNSGSRVRVGQWVGDLVTASQLRQDIDLNGATAAPPETGSRLTADFTQITLSIPGTATTLQVELALPWTGATEEFAFDDVRIIGDVLVPVEWVSLGGYATEEGIRLNWRTGAESQIDHFTVERLNADGIFEPLGDISPKANNGFGADYTFLDAAPMEGTNLYRITELDLDGQVHASPLFEVNTLAGSTVTSLEAFPVPAADYLQVSWGSPATEGARLILTDLSGRILLERTLGAHEVMAGFQLHEIPAGMYILQMQGMGAVPPLRFTKE